MFTTFEVEQDAVIVEVAIHEAMEFSQTYSVISGATVLRMTNGQGVKQTHWEKLSTSIDCSGPIPGGLTAIDYSRSYTLRCGAKRAINSSNPNITVPAARRTDVGYEVVGYALVPDGMGRGEWQETPVVMVVNVAQLTPVAGASVYRAYYWPEIIVFSDAPDENADVHGADYSWTLNAEEV